MVARQRLQGPPERGTIRRGIRELGQPAVGAAKGHPPSWRRPEAKHDPSLRELGPAGGADQPWGSRVPGAGPARAELAAAEAPRAPSQPSLALLHDMGYSLQANRKTLAGTEHPDRNAQFEHLDRAVQLQLSLGEPVISVDTKKKELVGPFKNGGRELRPKGAPEQVLVHDFLIPDLGRVSPYGVYDIAQNEAWVSVGTDHDTAAFAVESIRRWWRGMGQALYPSATRLLITADAGGSNGYRLRLWKLELQKLADETGLEIDVCHLPPGTSKWNKIEHRLFSAISQNWRGKPLVSHEVVVKMHGAAGWGVPGRAHKDITSSHPPCPATSGVLTTVPGSQYYNDSLTRCFGNATYRRGCNTGWRVYIYEGIGRASGVPT